MIQLNVNLPPGVCLQAADSITLLGLVMVGSGTLLWDVLLVGTLPGAVAPVNTRSA